LPDNPRDGTPVSSIRDASIDRSPRQGFADPPPSPVAFDSRRDSPEEVFPSARSASPPRRAWRVLPIARCLPTYAMRHDPRAHPRAPVPDRPEAIGWREPRRTRPAVHPPHRGDRQTCQPPAQAVHAHSLSPKRALEGWVAPAAASRSRLPERCSPRRICIARKQPSAFHRFDPTRREPPRRLASDSSTPSEHPHRRPGTFFATGSPLP